MCSKNTIKEIRSRVNSLIALEYLYIEEYFMAKEYFIKCLNKDDRDNHSLYNIIYCFESMNDNLGAINLFMIRILFIAS